MESIIKYKWTILKLDERNFVKEQLFLIIKSQYLHQLFNDPIYIRNSLAKCVVELIKRDCFEKVNTTLDEFVNMIQEESKAALDRMRKMNNNKDDKDFQ